MDDHPGQTAVDWDHWPPTRESWIGRHGPYLLLLVFLHYSVQIARELFESRVDLLGMLPVVEASVLVLGAAAIAGVVARVGSQLVRRTPLDAILRDILGEPSSWKMWYPRGLRSPASIWDKLPPTLRILRTVIWLELFLLPAGFLLVVFVLPTFRVVYGAIGLEFPLAMRALIFAFEVGTYLLPVIALEVLVQSWRWCTERGLPRMVTLRAWFSASPGFWRESEARLLLNS